MLLLQTSRTTPDLHHRQVGVVVNKDGRVLQVAQGLFGALPLHVVELARLHATGINTRRGGQNSLGKFTATHFQGEEEGGLAHDRTHVNQDPEGEGGLSGGRSRAHDGEAGRLYSLQQGVQAAIPSFDTRNLTGVIRTLLEDVDFLH